MGKGSRTRRKARKRHSVLQPIGQLRLDKAFKKGCAKCGGILKPVKSWRMNNPKKQHILITTLLKCKNCGASKREYSTKRKPNA